MTKGFDIPFIAKTTTLLYRTLSLSHTHTYSLYIAYLLSLARTHSLALTTLFNATHAKISVGEIFYLAKFSLKYFDWSNMSNILSCARESVFVILWQTTVTSTDDKVFEKYIFSQNLRH